MPKIAITVEATAEVELAPKLKKALQLNLRTYADLKEQLDELKGMLSTVAEEIEALRVEADAKSIRVEGGFIVTRVDGGTTTKYSDVKLLAAGLTPKQLEACKTTKPKKPHTKITVPGGKDDEEE